ncbi:MAG: phage baseplate assembly protein [Deltaproteobacteria bacterium]|nr:phage baseplate assembly protein [Deltaproteobacteria bacterium]
MKDHSIRQKLSRILSFGRISHYQEDNPSLARTVWGDVLKDRSRILSHFGLASKAPAGSPCTGISCGSHDSLVVIAAGSQEITDLKEGDTVLYSKGSDGISAKISLKNDGTVTVKAEKLILQCGSLSIQSSTGEDLISVLSEAIRSIAQSSADGHSLQPFSAQSSKTLAKLKSFGG